MGNSIACQIHLVAGVGFQHLSDIRPENSIDGKENDENETHACKEIMPFWDGYIVLAIDKERRKKRIKIKK